MPTYKRCTRCKLQKSTESFNKDKQSKDGFTSWCIECKRVYRISKKEEVGMVSNKSTKKIYPRWRHRWTEEEDRQVLALAGDLNARDVGRVAHTIDRTPKAVTDRYYKLRRMEKANPSPEELPLTNADPEPGWWEVKHPEQVPEQTKVVDQELLQRLTAINNSLVELHRELRTKPKKKVGVLRELFRYLW